MNAPRQPLEVGWQSRPLALSTVCAGAALAALTGTLYAGAVAGFLALCTATLAALVRMQWAILEGASLRLRDATSGYMDRLVPARQVAAVRFRRSPLPWCRLRTERTAGGVCLVLSGPSPHLFPLRCITLWMIVHGRRRARIDARLLDALAAMPEHGPARQPHDASHA